MEQGQSAQKPKLYISSDPIQVHLTDRNDVLQVHVYKAKWPHVFVTKVDLYPPFSAVLVPSSFQQSIHAARLAFVPLNTLYANLTQTKPVAMNLKARYLFLPRSNDQASFNRFYSVGCTSDTLNFATFSPNGAPEGYTWIVFPQFEFTFDTDGIIKSKTRIYLNLELLVDRNWQLVGLPPIAVANKNDDVQTLEMFALYPNAFQLDEHRMIQPTDMNIIGTYFGGGKSGKRSNYEVWVEFYQLLTINNMLCDEFVVSQQAEVLNACEIRVKIPPEVRHEGTYAVHLLIKRTKHDAFHRCPQVAQIVVNGVQNQKPVADAVDAAARLLDSVDAITATDSSSIFPAEMNDHQIYLPNQYSQTLFHKSIFSHNVKLVDHLISLAKSANRLESVLEARDVFGRTPLHWAVETGDFEMTKLLLKTMACRKAIELGAWFGQTPLQSAVIHDYLDIAEELLKYGANPNDADDEGMMVWDYFEQFEGSPELGRLLKRFGAISARDKSAIFSSTRKVMPTQSLYEIVVDKTAQKTPMGDVDLKTSWSVQSPTAESSRTGRD